MAKKIKTQVVKPEKKGEFPKGINQRGKIVIACGIGLLVIGFFVLTKTNPEGSNWASILSPILIISGYITIAIGIIV
ncbi:MAG TPA: hypothetical protein DHV62_04410 [Elusimicrobia bacterium]|jgi:hypothetical protein|nr:hypothetical protein [Elusimicrobiota bacterium]